MLVLVLVLMMDVMGKESGRALTDPGNKRRRKVTGPKKEQRKEKLRKVSFLTDHNVSRGQALNLYHIQGRQDPISWSDGRPGPPN